MKQNSLRSRRKTIYPTPAEDQAIRAGIAADPDTRELTRAEIGTLRPAAEVLSPQMMAQLRSGKVKVVAESDAQWEKRTRRQGERGKQVAPTKQLVSLRLSADVLQHFRATGPGWQTRIDEHLKTLIKSQAKRVARPAAASRKKPPASKSARQAAA